MLMHMVSLVMRLALMQTVCHLTLGKYVPAHRRQGQPGLLPKSRSEEILSRSESTLD